jgi:hypothetical protein
VGAGDSAGIGTGACTGTGTGVLNHVKNKLLFNKKKNETMCAGAGISTGACTGTGIGTGVLNHVKNKLLLLIHLHADMEVDDPAVGLMRADGTGQTTTAAAQRTDETCGDEILNVQAVPQPVTSSYALRPDLTKTENTGNHLVSQCSNAKKLSRSVTVHDCSATEDGPVFSTGNATLPRIGSMFPADTDDYKKTFHGARITKNGTVVNEVISCSFDPKTLNCLACQTPQRIINANVPVTICFADQNFVPTVCCRSGTTSSCLVLSDMRMHHCLSSLPLRVRYYRAIQFRPVVYFYWAPHPTCLE